jgi:hypothetical protein
MTAEDLRQLPKAEKLRMMEMIWSDLTDGKEDFVSPDWHEAELKRTADRVKSGCELPIDWTEAKEQLRFERK